MSTTFTLAHFSDVHLPLPSGLTLAHFQAKRLFGLANWHRHRKHVHKRAVLDRLVADLGRSGADHVAVTGDLVNLGLPSEHEAALTWLQELGPPARVSVVPGNHDAYVRLRRHPGHRCWAEYMSGQLDGAGGTQGQEFPFVRRFGKVALIGLTSGVPTPPIVSYGRLGPAQRQAARSILRRLRAEGLARVVLLHHPPFQMPAAWRMGLTDASELLAVLAEEGAELVLHGHLHRPMVNWAKGPDGPIPLVGVASASEGRGRKPSDLARYHLYRLSFAGKRPKIELIARGLTEPEGPVHELERRFLIG